MNVIITFLCFWVLSFTGPVLGQEVLQQDDYHEELVLQRLQNGDLLVISCVYVVSIGIQVMLSLEQSTQSLRHNVKFPVAISSLMRSSPFHSMEVHSTQGHWYEEKWGIAPMEVHPHGAEVFGWLDPAIHNQEAPSVWNGLMMDLSALFCASFGSASSSEKVIFTKSGCPPFESPYSKMTAFLPQEPVCVENLTPWLKLLPCKGKRGLSSIFRSQALFQGVFHGMHTRILKTGDVLVLSQKLEVVFKESVLTKDTEFQKLLSNKGFVSCPVADTAHLLIDQKLPLLLDQEAGSGFSLSKVRDFTSYEIGNPAKNYSFVITEDKAKIEDLKDSRSAFSGQLYLTGTRGNEGTLIIELKSTSDSDSGPKQVVCLLQSFPWIIKVWFHSLKINIDGKEVMNFKQELQYFHVQVSDDRKAPSVLDTCMEVVHSVIIQVQFTKAFLFLEEHPPDAYRGVDIPPTLVYIFNTTETAKEAQPWNHSWSIKDTPSRPYTQLYIAGSLVRILVPDFSMQYNVCIMTSTLLALLFGFMMKELTQEDNEEEEQKYRDVKRRIKINTVIFAVMVTSFGYFYHSLLPSLNPTDTQS